MLYCHVLYRRYGNLVLAVEVISSTATIGYAILLMKQSKPKPSLGLPIADPNQQLHPDDVMFNLRVLIPCYKEKVSPAQLGPTWEPGPANDCGSILVAQLASY